MVWHDCMITSFSSWKLDHLYIVAALFETRPALCSQLLSVAYAFTLHVDSPIHVARCPSCTQHWQVHQSIWERVPDRTTDLAGLCYSTHLQWCPGLAYSKLVWVCLPKASQLLLFITLIHRASEKKLALLPKQKTPFPGWKMKLKNQQAFTWLSTTELKPINLCKHLCYNEMLRRNEQEICKHHAGSTTDSVVPHGVYVTGNKQVMKCISTATDLTEARDRLVYRLTRYLGRRQLQMVMHVACSNAIKPAKGRISLRCYAKSSWHWCTTRNEHDMMQILHWIAGQAYWIQTMHSADMDWIR